MIIRNYSRLENLVELLVLSNGRKFFFIRETNFCGGSVEI